METYVVELEDKGIVRYYIPGLRGSHILNVPSEPPADTRAELSPPTSIQLRTLPQNCNGKLIPEQCEWQNQTNSLHPKGNKVAPTQEL